MHLQEEHAAVAHDKFWAMKKASGLRGSTLV